MAVREAGSRWRGDADGADRLLRELRGRWRTASFAAGWRFPSDWGVPEVDDVCQSVVTGADLPAALGGLGRARARAGAGLDETLADLAALHRVLVAPNGTVPEAPQGTARDTSNGAVREASNGTAREASNGTASKAPDGAALDASDGAGLEAAGDGGSDPDAVPSRMLRATALAWADAALGELSAVAATENLTGLATTEYLRVRIGEVYRAGRRGDFAPADRFVLLVVSVDLSRTAGWPRLMAMALVGDVLREVFDGGESLAVLGPSVAAVLAERGRGLAERAARTRKLIAGRLGVDSALRSARRAEIRLERLPCSEAAAQALVDRLSRA